MQIVSWKLGMCVAILLLTFVGCGGETARDKADREKMEARKQNFQMQQVMEAMKESETKSGATKSSETTAPKE